MAEARAVFLEGNLFRHITAMALTSSVGLMAVFAVDFIDMIFISMLDHASALPLGANRYYWSVGRDAFG